MLWLPTFSLSLVIGCIFCYPQDKRLVEREGEILLLDLEEKNSTPVCLNWFENQPTDIFLKPHLKVELGFIFSWLFGCSAKPPSLFHVNQNEIHLCKPLLEMSFDPSLQFLGLLD